MTDLRTAAQQALEELEDYERHTGFRSTATDALRAALAQQQEQEPVAWMYQWKNGTDRTRHVSTAKWPESNEWAEWPLYTNPPRREWQGLTEEEIEDLRDDRYFRFARAIEAALKERNT